MKIIDSFIFYNEIELLKYRLSILNEFVDTVVLVESTHTFTGLEKPLYYEKNKELFAEFNHKIIHVVVSDFPYQSFVNSGAQWNNESFQRNCIERGINKLNLNDDDIIVTSDLDEIINPDILKKALNSTLEYDRNGLNKCALDMYYYNLNTRTGKGNWHGVKLFTYNAYKRQNLSFQDMRNWEHSHHVNMIPNGGWHLSYFGNEQFIKNKILNFSHQELITPRVIDEYMIKSHINNSTDIYNRQVSYERISIKDNDNLPPKYDIYLKDYYSY